MKRIMLPFIFMALIISSFSCSSSSSDDAKKMAEFACRRQRLSGAVLMGDEKAKKELEAFRKERKEFVEKMEEKYKGKPEERAKVEEEARQLAKKCLPR